MEEALRRETERLNQMLEIAATGRFLIPKIMSIPTLILCILLRKVMD
ncbi:hypothetical protein HMSSN036_31210 [Paenibacillus macerans]|nr:hypothetical protein HMSSN036_31210 [Paenibacillus macerans]